MNSPVFGWLLPLYLGVCSALPAAAFEAETWWTMAALRRLDRTPDSTVVAYWAGPDTRRPGAAFLALHNRQSGVRSIVALNADERVRFDGKVAVESAAKADTVESLDVVGVRLRDRVVLFHAGAGLLRSAFSFDTGHAGPERLRFIVTGIAPGVWEIWRDGWVVDIGVPVRAKEAVLYFEERPGSFFVRKLN
jgi:hypothetical protein